MAAGAVAVGGQAVAGTDVVVLEAHHTHFVVVPAALRGVVAE